MTIKFGRFDVQLQAGPKAPVDYYLGALPGSCWSLRLDYYGGGWWDASVVTSEMFVVTEISGYQTSAQAAADALESLIRSLAGAVL